MNRIVAIIGLCLALDACSGIKDNLAESRLLGGGDPIKTLGQFTVTDLQSALADARDHGDTVGAGCWAALIPLVQKYANRGTGPDVAGAFSAFQKARNLRRTKDNGLPDGVSVACAPVILDTEATIARLGAVAMPGGGLLGGILR